MEVEEEEEIWSGGGVKDGYSRPALLLPALLPAPPPIIPPSINESAEGATQPDGQLQRWRSRREGGRREERERGRAGRSWEVKNRGEKMELRRTPAGG